MASDIVIILGIVLMGAYLALQYYEARRRRIKLERKKRDATTSENNPRQF